MSEDNQGPEDVQVPEQKTAMAEFKGMEVEVKLPTPSQLGIYQVLKKKFQRAAREGKDLDSMEATRLLGNIFELVTSIVVSPDDVDFIQSEILSGRAEIDDVLPLINQGIEALKVSNNIEDEAPKTRVVTSSS